jgi:hypothetical protein
MARRPHFPAPRGFAISAQMMGDMQKINPERPFFAECQHRLRSEQTRDMNFSCREPRSVVQFARHEGRGAMFRSAIITTLESAAV